MLTELEDIVLHDLKALRRLCRDTDLSVGDVRDSSSRLAKLVINDGGGVLPKVASWRTLNLVISCPINDVTVSRLKGVAEVYTCGHACIAGVKSSSFTQSSHRLLTKLPLAGEGYDDRQVISLGKFKQQICAMWMGITVSREDLIKYVRNKLGGDHYDDSRKDKNSRLRLSYNALDFIRYKWQTMKNLDPVFFELLATASFLTESASIKELVSLLEAEA